ncbi:MULTISPECIES: hypothetical protein [Collinsella]|uniref:hypothetical protein n=1 Tax=Collinsella TaxID=102106 RepID=UPI001C238440|nr:MULTISPECIES: hypothetical protein [Collinsella]MBU9001097.1 hypothetical protein [Collinsella aerofaciens]MBU9063825.1 hypothetical protein [Collinsella sp. MSK.8.10]MCB5366479.1 hypothetical protein [Collinsella aerofaciens]MCB5368939.1 hypothetical protein [Collinsella aerofaciens]
MAKTVYSDNQQNVDALAERLSGQTSLSAERAKLVAYDLLCRKALKIKSSALAQIFRSVDKECDTKAMRDELIAAKIVTKIEGSGINGRPAFYTINAEIHDAQEQPVEDSVEVSAAEEVASREHIDTDELLDEHVVRAFTAKAGRGGFGGGGKRDAQRRAQQERFRRAVAQKDGAVTEVVENEPVAEPQEPVKEQKSAEPQESKRRRGAHFKAEQQDVVREAEEAAEAADDSEKPAKKASDSCRPGRGFAGRAYPVKRQEKVNQVPEVQAEKAVKPAESEVREQKPVDGRTVSDTETQGQQPAVEQTGEGTSSKPRRRRHRGGRGSNAQDAAENVAPRDEDAKVDAPMEQPKRQPAKEGKPERSQKQASTSKRERNVQGDSKRKSQKRPESAAADTAAQQAESITHGEVSAFALARVLGRQLLKVVPTPTALSKIKEQQTQIVRVEGKDGKKTPQRAQHNEMSNRKIAEEIAIIQAWIEQNRGADTPVASRRQRAYQIFNDEKAFDGKHGERLIRRMTEKGISMQAIKVAPNRPVHFTSFFTLGADKPFIMVENLDTYDEIVKLLRGRKHAKLFGTKVGGVIFGGGCKASVSHALDDYLAEIGYRFNYVYYVGDIDREGARIVEQARNANVVEIRLHAGMYRAMLAEHKRRVKAGGECEPAAANQGVPQNLAATIKDLPMVTRVQFRNVLREGGRIPQEILMTADYRDGDSGSFDRMLNN